MTGLNKISQVSNLFRNKSKINPSIDSFSQALNKKKNIHFLSAKTSSKLEKIANDKFGVEFKTIERSGLMKVLFERPQNVDVKDYNVKVSKFISYLEDCKIPRFQTLTQSRLSQIIAGGEAYLKCGNGKREQAKAEGRDEEGGSISRADSRSVRTESRLSGRDDESLSNVKDDKQEQAHTQTQEKEQKQIDSLKKRINVSRDDLLSALRKKKDNVTQSDKTFTKIDKILERDFLISCKKIHKTLGGERVRLPRTRKDDEHDKNVSILIKHLDRYINISAESETTKDHLSKIKEKAQDYLDKVNNAIVARQIKDETLATHKRKMLSENINGQNEPIYEDINSQNKPLTAQGPETASASAKKIHKHKFKPVLSEIVKRSSINQETAQGLETASASVKKTHKQEVKQGRGEIAKKLNVNQETAQGPETASASEKKIHKHKFKPVLSEIVKRSSINQETAQGLETASASVKKTHKQEVKQGRGEIAKKLNVNQETAQGPETASASEKKIHEQKFKSVLDAIVKSSHVIHETA